MTKLIYKLATSTTALLQNKITYKQLFQQYKPDKLYPNMTLYLSKNRAHIDFALRFVDKIFEN